MSGLVTNCFPTFDIEFVQLIYAGAPAYTKWPKAVTSLMASDVDPVVRFPFKITRSNRVATAGSCFAQHIARNLASSGYNYYVAEDSHPLLRNVATKYGYGLFSARYGNIYTSRQLVQLVRRAYGKFTPQDAIWQSPDGSFFDLLRPTVQPGGFISRQELELDIAQHLSAVRQMFERLDYFVFTLGLTEVWIHRKDETAYPMCPGTAAGTYDPQKYEFKNLSVLDVVGDMTEVFTTLKTVNPNARMILTVSPVALQATAEDRHVLCSTVYSKSVLRVAAESLAAAHPDIAYFPSYEIITGPQSRGAYFDETLRDVRPDGVKQVMRLFFAHATDASVPVEAGEPSLNQATEAVVSDIENFIKAECDEAMLAE